MQTSQTVITNGHRSSRLAWNFSANGTENSTDIKLWTSSCALNYPWQFWRHENQTKTQPKPTHPTKKYIRKRPSTHNLTAILGPSSNHLHTNFTTKSPAGHTTNFTSHLPCATTTFWPRINPPDLDSFPSSRTVGPGTWEGDLTNTTAATMREF